MYLLFDIGGTKMRIASSRDLKKLDDVKVAPTPRHFRQGMTLMGEVFASFAKKQKIAAMAGGVAGTFNAKKTKLLTSPNLSGWIHKPLQKELRRMTKAPVFIENDAALGGLGEALFGAGRGKEIVMYLVVSTGVGGTRIVEGRIDRNALGFEPGHQLIALPSRKSFNVMSLENLISGTAVKKRYGISPAAVTDLRVHQELGDYLAIGLANSLVHWSPDVVILGGPLVVGENAIPINRVQRTLRRILPIYQKLPHLKKAELGDRAGLYGAMAYLQSQASRG